MVAALPLRSAVVQVDRCSEEQPRHQPLAELREVAALSLEEQQQAGVLCSVAVRPLAVHSVVVLQAAAPCSEVLLLPQAAAPFSGQQQRAVPCSGVAPPLHRAHRYSVEQQQEATPHSEDPLQHRQEAASSAVLRLQQPRPSEERLQQRQAEPASLEEQLLQQLLPLVYLVVPVLLRQALSVVLLRHQPQRRLAVRQQQAGLMPSLLALLLRLHLLQGSLAAAAVSAVRLEVRQVPLPSVAPAQHRLHSGEPLQLLPLRQERLHLEAPLPLQECLQLAHSQTPPPLPIHLEPLRRLLPLQGLHLAVLEGVAVPLLLLKAAVQVWRPSTVSTASNLGRSPKRPHRPSCASCPCAPLVYILQSSEG